MTVGTRYGWAPSDVFAGRLRGSTWYPRCLNAFQLLGEIATLQMAKALLSQRFVLQSIAGRKRINKMGVKHPPSQQHQYFNCCSMNYIYSLLRNIWFLESEPCRVG